MRTRSLFAAAVLIAAALILSLTGAGIGPGTASASRPHLTATRLWTQTLTNIADSVPAYGAHPGIASCSGSAAARPLCRHRVPTVYLLAGNNGSNCSPGNPVRVATLYALNARTGVIRWSRGTSGPARCTTAGPAVQQGGAWVYAPGLDGKIHRYNGATGKEFKGGKWPVPYTLMPDVEKASADLTITGHYLYVTTSGYIGDQGHYEGHLVTIDLRTGGSHVFNSLCSTTHTLLVANSGSPHYCSSVQSGLFGRGQGVTDPLNHDVYVVSGNGPWNGTTNWGDSILKLNPAGTRLIDAFTPTNQATLNRTDADLGSTGPALLPDLHSGGTYHLLVQGGKGPACDGCNGVALRLLNRDNLSGAGGPGHLGGDLADSTAPGGCEVLTAPAVWSAPDGSAWVFYANGCGLGAYRVAAGAVAGKFGLIRAWSASHGGSTPVLAGGVIYVARSGEVTAYDPATGAILAHLTGIGGIHWEYPLVAAGRLYISDGSGHLTAFGLSG